MKSDLGVLCQKLCEEKTYEQIGRNLSTIKALMMSKDLVNDLVVIMEQKIEQNDWGCLSKLMNLIYSFPNKAFTPVLCHLLNNHRQDVFMEAIADALMDIEDERSIPSIVNALNYHVGGDEDWHFNRKLVAALAHIGNLGNKDAIEGLKTATNHPKDLVREEAESYLTDLIG